MIDAHRSTTIGGLLDTLVAAYNDTRPDDAVDLFTDDAIFVGTGADEVRIGRSEIRTQVERDLDQADTLTVRVGDLRVVETNAAESCYALVTLEAVVGGETVTMPMRFTATARADGEGMRFSQVHFSLAAADQAEGQSFGEPADSPVPGIQRGRADARAWSHTSLAVADLDAAAAFYRQGFGYEIVYETRDVGEPVERLLGLPGARADVVGLLSPISGHLLELIEWSLPGGERRGAPTSPGSAHVAFTVDDVASAAANLRQLGAEQIGDVVQAFGTRFLYMREPAGTVIELDQEL